MPDEPLGLRIFSPPGGWGGWTALHGPPTLDVVMVHGLNGGRVSTWTKENLCWPQDTLYKKLPDLRVMTFGYNANLLFSSSTSKIRDYSLKLLTDLRDKRESAQEKKRPIAFISHSLGGIVVKKALIIASIDVQYRGIWSSTVGIVFFGTPHRGASIATAGKIISKAIGFTASRTDLLSALERNQDGLQEITEDFTRICTNFSIKSFYETNRVIGVAEIVPKYSATINIPQEEAIPMDGDHREICRFSKEDDRFEAVWKAVARIKARKAPPSSECPNLRLTEAEQKFIESLPGHDIGSFLDSQAQPHPNSCDWLPKDKTFLKFLSSQSTHILRIVGEPGSGKSTAAAWLLRTSRSWCPDREPLLFSFHGKSRASAAWSSLLFQLLHVDGTSTVAVHDALEDEDQSSRWKSEHSSSELWTFSRLRDIFISVVNRLSDSFQTLFIVDAVDECDGTLYDFLGSIADVLRATSSSRVKFLFLSRQISASAIDGKFESVGGTFQINMNENSVHIENVHRFITTKVDELCRYRDGFPLLRSEIIQELQKSSVGIYLLASLNLKALRTAKATKRNIRSVIRTLPGDLKAIYSQALDKVAPADQRRVAALLLWIIFAVRPLRKWELSAAVAMTYVDYPILTETDLKDQVSFDILGDVGIHELVGPLIRVTGGDLVSLVHSSARQYLLSLAPKSTDRNHRSTHDWVWRWAREFTERKLDSVDAMASQLLTINCRDLISFAYRVNISGSLPDPPLVNNPDAGIRSLLRYAIENLPDHVRQAPSGQDTSSLFASFLKSANGAAWMRQFWRLRDPTQPYRGFSPLAFCCALGLVDAVKAILSLDQYPRTVLSDVEAVQRAEADATELLTAADLAAMFGNVEILKLLCEEMGTPADSDRLIPQTSWKATTEGWVHIGQNLGHYHVPVPAPGTRGEDVVNEHQIAVENLSWYRPLHTATVYGHAEAAGYLISRGASISREGENGQWAVEIAMENKINGLVDLLLLHHSEDIAELVHRFVEIGSQINIDRLLHRRPELLTTNTQDFISTLFGTNWGSILHEVAAAGNAPLFKFLVRSGADSGFKDSAGRQAIHYAAASGQASFIETILAEGMATRTDEDALGRSPLFYATLGAGCNHYEKWLSTSESELVIQILTSGVTAAIRRSLVEIALRSLAKFDLDVPYIISEDMGYDMGEDMSEDKKDGLTQKFEKRLRTLQLIAHGITLDGDFLYDAAKSTLFPLKFALELTSDINEANSQGRTALHGAAVVKAIWGSWHKTLVDMVTDIDHRDLEGRTALHLVVESHNVVPEDQFWRIARDIIPRIKMLVNHGADATCADIRGVTPISAAADYLLTASHSSIPDGLLTSLFSGGIKATKSNMAESISDDVLPRLIDKLSTSWRQEDLASLVEAMSMQQRKHWLQLEPDKKRTSATVFITCHKARWSRKDLATITSHLSEEGLKAAFSAALQRKSRDMVEILRLHPRPGQKASWGGDIRHVVDRVQSGDMETVKFYIEVMNGDSDGRDTSGQTILSHAAERGQVEMTRYLLSCGAKTSLKDLDGRSAVYWAAREGKFDTLKLLVESGARVTRNDVAIATEMNRGAIRAYLKEHVRTLGNVLNRKTISGRTV